MNKPYNQETEQLMQLYYVRLAEKEKRHYAALEACKLGNGGKQYIGWLLKISQKTLRKGERELTQVELYAQIPEGKQRRAGGGRKKFCPSS
jgi:hypothetical protein